MWLRAMRRGNVISSVYHKWNKNRKTHSCAFENIIIYFISENSPLPHPKPHNHHRCALSCGIRVIIKTKAVFEQHTRVLGFYLILLYFICPLLRRNSRLLNIQISKNKTCALFVVKTMPLSVKVSNTNNRNMQNSCTYIIYLLVVNNGNNNMNN